MKEDWEDFFDYWCPDDENYVLLEKNKYDTNILNGWCALCGKDITITYKDWKKYDDKRMKNE